jgi:hypothetical protein
MHARSVAMFCCYAIPCNAYTSPAFTQAAKSESAEKKKRIAERQDLAVRRMQARTEAPSTEAGSAPEQPTENATNTIYLYVTGDGNTNSSDKEGAGGTGETGERPAVSTGSTESKQTQQTTSAAGKAAKKALLPKQNAAAMTAGFNDLCNMVTEHLPALLKASSPQGAPTLRERLTELQTLFEDGIISEEELASGRSALLGGGRPN